MGGSVIFKSVDKFPPITRRKRISQLSQNKLAKEYVDIVTFGQAIYKNKLASNILNKEWRNKIKQPPFIFVMSIFPLDN